MVTIRYSHSPDIRLADSISSTPGIVSGHIEIHINGKWGTICNEGWDIKDAVVACKQLGYWTAIDTKYSVKNGRGQGSILMSNVNCSGWENSLVQCAHSRFTECPNFRVVEVTCYSQGK